MTACLVLFGVKCHARVTAEGLQCEAEIGPRARYPRTHKRRHVGSHINLLSSCGDVERRRLAVRHCRSRHLGQRGLRPIARNLEYLNGTASRRGVHPKLQGRLADLIRRQSGRQRR